MAERPIIFSDPEVRALLGGRKTQARRVLTKKAAHDALAVFVPSMLLQRGNVDLVGYAPGDRLWVRESLHRDPYLWKYRADNAVVGWPALSDLASQPRDYISSIHMPRGACRLTLTVTDVRVQRVQDISPRDVLCEGIEVPEHHRGGLHDPHRWAHDHFRPLWDALRLQSKRHGTSSFGWAANPWVAALTFTVERQ